MSAAVEEKPKRQKPTRSLSFIVQAASELSGLGKTTLYALMRALWVGIGPPLALLALLALAGLLRIPTL